MNVLESLIAELREVCAGVPDRRKAPRDVDYLMAGYRSVRVFSMFFMGSPSFLAHQRRLEEGHGRSSCQTLFNMSAIPTDAYARLMLDGAATASFDPRFFKTIEQRASSLRSSGLAGE